MHRSPEPRNPSSGLASTGAWRWRLVPGPAAMARGQWRTRDLVRWARETGLAFGGSSENQQAAGDAPFGPAGGGAPEKQDSGGRRRVGKAGRRRAASRRKAGRRRAASRRKAGRRRAAARRKAGRRRRRRKLMVGGGIREVVTFGWNL
jgi:hypothetical protein